MEVEDITVPSAASKRRKITHSATMTTTTAPLSAQDRTDAVSVQESASKDSKRAAINDSSENKKQEGNRCYKCGKVGHWAVDCYEIENFDIEDKECPCGFGICIIMTAKTQKNPGRKFYQCPRKHNSCGFFAWCSDNINASVLSGSVGFSWSYQNTSSMSNKNDNASNSACFRCGKEGHWAKDCKASAIVPSNTTGDSACSGSCFRCGKEGHWVKDCTQSLSNSTADKSTSNAFPGTCFKCGKPGHWARYCPEAKV